MNWLSAWRRPSVRRLGLGGAGLVVGLAQSRAGLLLRVRDDLAGLFFDIQQSFYDVAHRSTWTLWIASVSSSASRAETILS